MATLTMENPLSPTPEMIRRKTIEDLIECVSDLRDGFSMNGIPIDDDSQNVHRFCAKLEHLLQYGLKAKSSLISGKKDYWNYFYDCLAANKGLNDGIRFVKSLNEIKTNQGRGRAFLRFALVHHRLADTLQHCVYNTKVTSEWYIAKSLWLHSKEYSPLINTLYDLNDITFDLASRGYDLDTSWPSFARRTLEPHGWSLPSRSVSITSLNSTIQENLSSSFSNQPSISEAEVDSLKSELNESENDRLKLQYKMAANEQQQTDIASQLEEMTKQRDTLQSNLSEMEIKYAKLETELELHEGSWAEKEVLFMTSLDESAEIITELNSKFDGLKKQVDTSNMSKNFESTEAKGQIVLKDKQIQALRMELKASDMELRSVKLLEAQKSKLMALMEKKIVSLKERNVTLVAQGKADGVDGKAGGAQTPGETEFSADDRKLLEEKLECSTKLNTDLKSANKELKQMLGSIEEKGSAISKLAKEKLHKYSDANKQLQSDIEGIQGENKDLRAKLQAATDDICSANVQPAAGDSASSAETVETTSTGSGAANVDMKTTGSDAQTVDTTDTGSGETVSTAEISQQTANVSSTEKSTQHANDGESSSPVQVAPLEQPVSDEMDDLSPEEVITLLRSMRNEKNRLEAELQGATVTIEAKDISLATLQESILTLTEKFEILDRNSRDNRDELLTILKENYHLKQDLTSQRSANFQLASQKSQFEKYISSLREQLDAVEKAENAKQSAKDSANTNAADPSNPDDESLSNITQSGESLRIAVQSLENLSDNYTTTHNAYEQALQQLVLCDNDLCALWKTNNEFEEKLTDNEKELEKYQMMRNDHSKETSDLNDSLELITRTCETLHCDKETLQSELDEMLERVNGLKLDVQNRDGEIIRLQNVQVQKNSEMEDKVEELETIVRQQQNTNAQRETECIDLRSVVTEMEQKMELVISQSKEVAEHSESVRAGLITEVEEGKSNLQRANDSWEKKTKELEDEKHLVEVLLEERTTDFHKQHATLTNTLSMKESEWKSAMEKSLENFTQISNVLKDNISKMKDVIAKYVSDDLQMQLQLVKDSEQIDSFVEIVSKDFLQQKQSLGSLSIELSSLKSEQQSLTLTNETLQQSLDKNEISFEDREKDLNKELGDLQKLYTDIQDERNSMHTKLKSMEILQKENEERESEIEEELANKKQEIVTLEEKCMQLAKESERLKMTVQDTKVEMALLVESHRHEIQALRFELSSNDIQHQQALQNIECQQSNVSEMNSQLQIQEELVINLEQSLKSINEERQIDKQQHWVALEELKNTISMSEEDCKQMSEELKTKSEQLEAEKLSLMELQGKNKEALERELKQKETYEADITQLKSDIVKLKKNLIQVIRDKDSLWQEKDRLEFEHRVRSEDTWMDENDVTNCMSCKSGFSFLVRKHHCRLCGRVFCYACVNNWVKTSYSSKQERACNECYMNMSMLEGNLEGDAERDSLQSSGSHSNDPHSSNHSNTDVQTSNHSNQSESDSDDSVEIPRLLSRTWDRTLHLEDHGDEEEDCDDLTSKDMDVASQSSTPPVIDVVGQTPAPPASSRESTETATNITDAIKIDSNPVNDDLYDLITDDDITESLHDVLFDSSKMFHKETNIDSNAHSMITLTSGDELLVPAGKMYCVPIIVNSTEITIKWKFSTLYKNIHFSVCYKPLESPGDLEEVFLIPTCPCSSHKEAITGEITAHRSGVYTLNFDNTTSRFTSKKLSFNIDIGASSLMNAEENSDRQEPT